jgi:dinuclear metal center YbgI/SA1388 family protein
MSRRLSEVITTLQKLAALEWAEPWDNVGLLLEPTVDEVRSILLTIELTEEVLAEAQASQVNLVIAYHPIMFTGCKRLTQGTAGERIVIQAIRSGISIYSPHTALDAALWGMNDWLVQAFGTGNVTPIVPLPKAPPGTGLGRIVHLEQPQTLDALLVNIKQHLNLTQLRVAASQRHLEGATICSAAVCAGAGGSVFEKCATVDLLLTGEMRHHDILARRAAGTSVILADHTNTERGYLPHLASWLTDALGGDLRVIVSNIDSEPLKIV